MGKYSMLTGLNHITLSVSDLHRSFHFYVEILGFKPLAFWDSGAYLELGKLWLCLSFDEATRKAPQDGYLHIAFTVNQQDFQKVADALLKAGIKIWQDNKSEGDSLYFLDPDGHKLEIHVGSLQSRIKTLKQKPFKGLKFFE